MYKCFDVERHRRSMTPTHRQTKIKNRYETQQDQPPASLAVQWKFLELEGHLQHLSCLMFVPTATKIPDKQRSLSDSPQDL